MQHEQHYDSELHFWEMIETAYERDKRVRAENAERARRAAEYAAKMNLPVPVLAEPVTDVASNTVGRMPAGDHCQTNGEARESTTTPKGVSRRDERNTDSRGGQSLSKEKERKKRWYDKHGAEYMRLYRAQKKLKK